MSSVNKVILIGNIGADIDLKHTSSGVSVTELRLATHRKYTTKDGTAREDTQWHRVVVWGKQAESCKEYLYKGRQVYVEGRLQNRQWTDKQNNKRVTTEIVAEQIQFLGSGKGGVSTGNGFEEVPPIDDIDTNISSNTITQSDLTDIDKIL